MAHQVLLFEHGGVLHVAPDYFLLKHSDHRAPYSLHASALVYLAAMTAMDFALRAFRVEQVTVLQWLAPAEQAVVLQGVVVLQHFEVLQVGYTAKVGPRLESKA